MSVQDKTIGTNVRNHRLEKGMRQDDLADLTGLSKNYICLIETGRKFPSRKALCKIAEALKIPLNDLIKSEAIVVRLKNIAGNDLVDDLIQQIKLRSKYL